MVIAISGNWQNTTPTRGYSFICGYCGSTAGPSQEYQCIYRNAKGANVTNGEIFICPTCNQPTYIKNKHSINGIEQTPGPKIGNNIEFLPDDIKHLYDEARNCISVNAFTSAILSCRKLLMNVSVSRGAEPGKSFAFYVKYLEDNHFIPPNSREWVDHIRSKGNEATHEIPHMSKDDAIELLDFTEMLLRFVYEMPGKMVRHKS